MMGAPLRQQSAPPVPFADCRAINSLPTCSRAARPFQACRRHIRVACSRRKPPDQDPAWPHTRLAIAAVTTVAAVLTASAQPSWADLPTVSPSTATEMARPLPKGTVDKGRVWLVFLGGAAGLFLGAVALEKNSRFFPAIYKANQAMNASRQKAAEAERRAKEEEAIETQLEDAVLDGLTEARGRTGVSGAEQQPTEHVNAAHKEQNGGGAKAEGSAADGSPLAGSRDDAGSKRT